VLLAMATALAVSALSCSSGSASHRLGAAEPASAPAGGAPAAGAIVRVGDGPEGIVFDPKTRLVAIAVQRPDRLELLNASSLRPVRIVPLPGSARHLQLAGPGGPVLVPDESADELIQVELPRGEIRATAVGRQPHEAAAAGPVIVVGNELDGSISFIRNGSVVRTRADVKQPGGVVADGTIAAVVDVGAFTLSTFDLRTMARRAVKPAGSGPTHAVLAGGQRVLVVDTRGNALLVFSLDPLEQLTHLALPGAPYGVTIDRLTDTAWVTLTATNQVVGIDLSGPTPRVIARYPTVRQPNSVAVAPGSHVLWVTGTYSGVVERITR
jgi:DNA-binding beta-propeller fold protein YncE